MDDQVEAMYQFAVKCYEAGDKPQAAKLLVELLRRQYFHRRAWLFFHSIASPNQSLLDFARQVAKRFFPDREEEIIEYIHSIEGVSSSNWEPPQIKNSPSLSEAERLRKEAEEFLQQGNRRMAGQLIKQALAADIMSQETWQLAYQFFESKLPFETFQWKLAKQHFPDKAYLFEPPLNRQNKEPGFQATPPTQPQKFLANELLEEIDERKDDNLDKEFSLGNAFSWWFSAAIMGGYAMATIFVGEAILLLILAAGSLAATIMGLGGALEIFIFGLIGAFVIIGLLATTVGPVLYLIGIVIAIIGGIGGVVGGAIVGGAAFFVYTLTHFLIRPLRDTLTVIASIAVAVFTFHIGWNIYGLSLDGAAQTIFIVVNYLLVAIFGLMIGNGFISKPDESKTPDFQDRSRMAENLKKPWRFYGRFGSMLEKSDDDN